MSFHSRKANTSSKSHFLISFTKRPPHPGWKDSPMAATHSKRRPRQPQIRDQGEGNFIISPIIILGWVLHNSSHNHISYLSHFYAHHGAIRIRGTGSLEIWGDPIAPLCLPCLTSQFDRK